MKTINCLNCSKEFKPKRSSAKYCCRSCQSTHIGKLYGKERASSKKNGLTLVCGVCFHEFYVPNYRKDSTKFCSRRCTSIANPENTKKAQNASPIIKRSGLSEKRKYVVITINGRQIREHRHVMQVHRGRLLDRNEYVHHINGDPTDNRIENLQVMTNSEHQKLELSFFSLKFSSQNSKQ